MSGVKYPEPETGLPELNPSIAFSYRLDGQVAQRTDGRGIMLAYDYDDEDRLGGIVADVPQELSTNGLGDVDVTAIGMAYTYHPDGQLWQAATLAGVGGVLNDSVFTYGPFGLTATAAQTFNGMTRTIGYQWNLDLYGDAKPQDANRWRLTGMTYPTGLNADLTFIYGSENELNDLLNRVQATKRSSNSQRIAMWRYMGLSRVIGQSLGLVSPEVRYDYNPSGSVSGLDGHGRPIDKYWRKRSPATDLVRYQYGYDARGNRNFARITVPGLAAQDRSWLYRYDDLNRLVRASQGVLNTAGDGFEPTFPAQSHTWALDNLGNWPLTRGAASRREPPARTFHVSPRVQGWSAGTSDDSFRLFTEPAGAVDGIFNAGDTPLFRHHHAVTQQNEITTRWVGESGGDPVPENFAYDATGNLILDDDHYYVYDSFNP